MRHSRCQRLWNEVLTEPVSTSILRCNAFDLGVNFWPHASLSSNCANESVPWKRDVWSSLRRTGNRKWFGGMDYFMVGKDWSCGWPWLTLILTVQDQQGSALSAPFVTGEAFHQLVTLHSLQGARKRGGGDDIHPFIITKYPGIWPLGTGRISPLKWHLEGLGGSGSGRLLEWRGGGLDERWFSLV